MDVIAKIKLILDRLDLNSIEKDVFIANFQLGASNGVKDTNKNLFVCDPANRGRN